jgi:hypothetical protein
MKHIPKDVTRDARNGQFKPEAWGIKHPNISVRETVWTPSPKRGK